MNYNIVYFSPTNTTKKITKLIVECITTDAKEFDITNHTENLSFNKNDFLIIGIPVYSGRVPKLAKDTITSMRGKETPVALIATYGNRHYDDSLLELKTLVQSNGFIVIAAAAFVTEHSVIPAFGTGRPNDEDIISIHKFASLLKNKISMWDATNHYDLKINGNPNYRKYQSIPIKPHATSLCIKCGICAKNCPASAISMDNPKKTDKSKCVTCMRCTRICPKNARDFYAIENFIAKKSLEKLCREYKHPEIFI